MTNYYKDTATNSFEDTPSNTWEAEAALGEIDVSVPAFTSAGALSVNLTGDIVVGVPTFTSAGILGIDYGNDIDAILPAFVASIAERETPIKRIFTIDEENRISAIEKAELLA